MCEETLILYLEKKEYGSEQCRVRLLVCPGCASVEMSRKLVVPAHRLRSGHLPLNSFKFLMRKSDSPIYELCGVNDDVYHLLMECVRSAPVRQ
jgi:hypothetical protein